MTDAGLVPPTAGLMLRTGPLLTADARRALVDLVADVFGIDLGAIDRLGLWHPGYRAFSYLEGDRIVANVSLRPLRLMVAGRIVRAAQFHAIATRPAWRRRGLFGDLMARALRHAAVRFDPLLLFTESPALYQPFGFRLLAEHRFRGTLQCAAIAPPRAGWRRLDPGDPDDIRLVRRLHASRLPVSARCAVRDNDDVLILNALAHPAWRLLYLPEHAALVVQDGGPGMPRLLDLVAREFPPMDALAGALGLARPGSGIEVCFPPDRLAGHFQPLPHVPEDHDILMVRGSFETGDEPFMLPLTAIS